MRPMFAETWPDVALQVFLIVVAAAAAYIAVRIAVAAAVKHLIARRTQRCRRRQPHRVSSRNVA